MQLPETTLRWKRHSKLLLLACLALLLIGLPVLASSGGAFTLSWFTVDGGGGGSSGGSFALSGTIGQADAGGPLVGGSYEVDGGFWAGASAGKWQVYLPAVLH